jgi:hypothetical protein
MEEIKNCYKRTKELERNLVTDLFKKFVEENELDDNVFSNLKCDSFTYNFDDFNIFGKNITILHFNVTIYSNEEYMFEIFYEYEKMDKQSLNKTKIFIGDDDDPVYLSGETHGDYFVDHRDDVGQYQKHNDIEEDNLPSEYKETPKFTHKIINLIKQLNNNCKR